MSVRRRLRLWRTAACVLAVCFVGSVWPAGGERVDDESPCWSPDPAVYCGPGQIAPPAVVSSDGRYHTCGVVTEEGVTEHLDAYRARCG